MKVTVIAQIREEKFAKVEIAIVDYVCDQINQIETTVKVLRIVLFCSWLYEARSEGKFIQVPNNFTWFCHYCERMHEL